MDTQSRTSTNATPASSLKPKAKRGRTKANKEGNIPPAAITEATSSPQPKGAAPPVPSANGKPAKATSGSNNKKRKKKSKAKSSATPVAASSDDEGEETPKTKLKVVVRRLPPNVPEAVLWQAVTPWVRQHTAQPDDNVKPTVDWTKFVQGKLKDTSRPGTSNDPKAVAHVHSRAYLHFLSLDYLLDFHRNFDGHVFRDAKGNEYTALVEFAPHQKVPVETAARRKKEDARQGTIDEDADYLEFLASLEEKVAETDAGDDAQTTAEKTDAQLMAHLASRSAEASANAAKARQTPLLEHLRAQRAGRSESSALAAARDYLTRSNPAYNVVSAAPVDKGSKKKKSKGSAPAGRGAGAEVGNAAPIVPATKQPAAPGPVSDAGAAAGKKKAARQAKAEVPAQIPDASSSTTNTANAQRSAKAKGTAKAAAAGNKGKLADGAPQDDAKPGGKPGKKHKAQRQAIAAPPAPAPAPIAILKRSEPPPSQAAPNPPAPVAESSIPTGPRADNRGLTGGRGKSAARRGGKGANRGGQAAGNSSSAAAT